MKQTLTTIAVMMAIYRKLCFTPVGVFLATIANWVLLELKDGRIICFYLCTDADVTEECVVEEPPFPLLGLVLQVA